MIGAAGDIPDTPDRDGGPPSDGAPGTVHDTRTLCSDREEAKTWGAAGDTEEGSVMKIEVKKWLFLCVMNLKFSMCMCVTVPHP